MNVLDFAVGVFGEAWKRRVNQERNSGCDTSIDHGFSFLDFLIDENLWSGYRYQKAASSLTLSLSTCSQKFVTAFKNL